MKEWKRHAYAIVAISIALQLLVSLAPPTWFFQILVLTMNTNLLALVYAVYAYKKFEDATAGITSTKVWHLLDESYRSMTTGERGQFDRNLSRAVAFGLVVVDKIGGMDDEAFGNLLGRNLGARMRITPEEIRMKVSLVGGE